MALKDEALAIVASKIGPFKELAESLGKSRFLVYKSEVHAPEETALNMEAEDVEMEAIADAFRCEIKQQDKDFSLFFYMDERNPGGFLEIVDSGMPAPLAGGDNGISHMPDGSTYNSPTPQPLWNVPVPGYAKPGTGVINEIKTMLKSLFHDYFLEAVDDSKPEIAKLAKQQVVQRIQSI